MGDDMGAIGWERVTKSGPWGLLVLIVLVWLAQSIGIVPSEAKDAKQAVRDHVAQQERAIREQAETNNRLAGIEQLMRDNQERAAHRDRVMCINAAKTAADLDRCASIK